LRNELRDRQLLPQREVGVIGVRQVDDGGGAHVLVHAAGGAGHPLPLQGIAVIHQPEVYRRVRTEILVHGLRLAAHQRPAGGVAVVLAAQVEQRRAVSQVHVHRAGLSATGVIVASCTVSPASTMRPAVAALQVGHRVVVGELDARSGGEVLLAVAAAEVLAGEVVRQAHALAEVDRARALAGEEIGRQEIVDRFLQHPRPAVVGGDRGAHHLAAGEDAGAVFRQDGQVPPAVTLPGVPRIR
jgi:hypothetical protein